MLPIIPQPTPDATPAMQTMGNLMGTTETPVDGHHKDRTGAAADGNFEETFEQVATTAKRSEADRSNRASDDAQSTSPNRSDDAEVADELTIPPIEGGRVAEKSTQLPNPDGEETVPPNETDAEIQSLSEEVDRLITAASKADPDRVPAIVADEGVPRPLATEPQGTDLATETQKNVKALLGSDDGVSNPDTQLSLPAKQAALKSTSSGLTQTSALALASQANIEMAHNNQHVERATPKVDTSITSTGLQPQATDQQATLTQSTKPVSELPVHPTLSIEGRDSPRHRSSETPPLDVIKPHTATADMFSTVASARANLAPNASSVQSAQHLDQVLNQPLSLAEAAGREPSTRLSESNGEASILISNQSVSTTQSGPIVTLSARPEMAQNVAAQLMATVQKQGPGQYDIALNPPELGRVRMSVEAIDLGINVTISAERGDTMDLIKRHIDMLERQFRDLGHSMISFSFEDQSSDTGNDQGGTLITAQGEKDASDEPQPVEQGTAAVLVNGRLDIRV